MVGNENTVITQSWHDSFIEYLSDPMDGRTQKEWCYENKIDPSTVSRWKSKHRKEIYTEADRRRKGLISEIRQNNWKSLIARAQKDTKAVELIFKLLGDLVEKSETTHNYMRIDEKKTRISELLAKAKLKEQAIEKFKAEVTDAGVSGADSSQS